MKLTHLFSYIIFGLTLPLLILFVFVAHAQTTSVTSEPGATQQVTHSVALPAPATTVEVEAETAPTPLVRNYAKFTNIGSLCGQIDLVKPQKINDKGQIVGYARACDGESIHAFLWTKGKMKDLGALHKKDVSAAVDVNKKGVIVGYSESEEGGSKMFSYQKGRMKKYKAETYRARAINDAGTIVGEYFGDDIYPLGFTLIKGVTKKYPYSFFDVNNKGQAIGVDHRSFGSEYAIMLQNGKAIKLGVLPGDSLSIPVAINNNGAIVGYSSHYPVCHAFLWKNGVMSQINIPRTSFDLDINDHEQIITRTFLYQNGETVDLNDLLPPDIEWEIYEARSINNKGQIVGSAWHKNNSQTIGFLLELPDEYKF